MQLLDVRRLTGPSHIWEKPGAILDVSCEPQRVVPLLRLWTVHVGRMLEAVGWSNEHKTHRRLVGGVALALSAPIDALYAATELAEWSFAACQADLDGAELPDFDASRDQLRAAIESERNPALLALAAAAHQHGVAFLGDDDSVSIGLGRGAQTFAVEAIPAPAQIDWAAVHDVPIGLVTGTNGKTTSVRMVAGMVRAGGQNVGLSSTDWIAVNDKVLDRGDWSGPGGARAVLRHSDVDVGVLETARGGLLRRGLAVAHADAALITNIAEDHLGDFGSQNLAELLNIKWIVTKVLGDNGRLVLNADDPLLRKQSKHATSPIVWFSLFADNPLIRAHTAAGGDALCLVDDALCVFDHGDWRALCSVASVPLAFGGAARHNLANALGAIGFARALGVSEAAVVAGLQGLAVNDNAGRCNIFQIDGVEVLVDFAHNVQSMAALFDIARERSAKRRLLAFGQAGDRTDRSIRELAQTAWKIGLDRVLISELADAYRGRAPGEVYELLRDALIDDGARADQIDHHETEIQSLDAALAWAQPGDLIIMLALGSRDAILDKLRGL